MMKEMEPRKQPDHWHEKTRVLQNVREAIGLNIVRAKELGIDDRWLEVFRTWSRECDQEIDYLAGLPNTPEMGPQSFDRVHGPYGEESDHG